MSDGVRVPTYIWTHVLGGTADHREKQQVAEEKGTNERMDQLMNGWAVPEYEPMEAVRGRLEI